MKRTILSLVVAAVLVVAVAGCSASGKTHQSGNAAWTNSGPGNVTLMPSGFRNVASKCVKVGTQWFAVFSASNGGNGDNLPGSVAAWPDGSCAQGLGNGK